MVPHREIITAVLFVQSSLEEAPHAGAFSSLPNLQWLTFRDLPMGDIGTLFRTNRNISHIWYVTATLFSSLKRTRMEGESQPVASELLVCSF